MITGAAGATINRLPVLLLPGDIFATRVARPGAAGAGGPALLRHLGQRLLQAGLAASGTGSTGPSSCPSALLAAMRVLTDPAETGAVTLALPQDVQAEAYDWPEELFASARLARRPAAPRAGRPGPGRRADQSGRAAADRRRRRGDLQRGHGTSCEPSPRRYGVPVAETQAGKGALPYGHPLAMGAIGATGTTAANALAREADLIIGVGTRYSDFTTASRTLFADGAAFVNLNITGFDAAKLSGLQLVADAREGLTELAEACAGWATSAGYRSRAAELSRAWDAVVDEAYSLDGTPAAAVRRDRRRQRGRRRRRRGGLRGRLHARRPAQALAAQRPRAAITSSTATPAWATRSRAASASSWPSRTARSSSWSATAPT